MNAKSLLLFLAIAGAVAWFSFDHSGKTPTKPANLAEPYQKQLDKAKGVERQLQQAADRRMKGSGVE